MIWIALAALTAATLALVAWPLLRKPKGAAVSRVDYDLAVYRDQLAEVEKDQARGLLTADQAAAARVEIQRRMLAAGQAAEEGPTVQPKGAKALAAVLLVALPAAGFAVYASLGNPALPGMPFAERVAARTGMAVDQVAKVQEMTDKLAAELARAPNPQGFVALANGYRLLGRYEEAMKAYGRAIEMGADDAETYSSLGELIVTKSEGAVGPEARTAFLEALKADPTEPRSRYYLGLSKAQIGKVEDAIAIWRDLEQSSPEGAPWLPMVREQITQAAAQIGKDPASIAPKRPDDQPAGAGRIQAPQQQASQQRAGVPTPPPGMSAEDQDAMVRQMVEGLAAKLEENPGDIQGWLRLARSYRVMGEPAKARQAFERAQAQAPQDIDVKLAFADFLLSESADKTALPPQALDLFKQVNQINPKNPDALYFLGLAAAQTGDTKAARDYWTRLLDAIPADSPVREQIKAQLQGL